MKNINTTETEKKSLFIPSLPKSMLVIPTVGRVTPTQTMYTIDAHVCEEIELEQNPKPKQSY